MRILFIISLLSFVLISCTSKLETADLTKQSDAQTPQENANIQQGSIYTQPKEPTDNLGKNGDAWFDTSSLNWWSKKDGKWSVDANLITSRSPSTISGTTVPLLLSGQGIPSSTLGKNDDIYLDLTTGILYKKMMSVWLYSLSLKGSSGLNGTSGQSYGIDLSNAVTTICPNGGITVSTYLDVNLNSKKDDDESIISSKSVCNGVTSSSGAGSGTPTSGLSATTTIVSGQEFSTQITGTTQDDVIYVTGYNKNILVDGKEGINTIVVSDYFNYFTYIIGDTNTLYLRFQNYGTIKLVNVKYVQFGNAAYLFNGSTFTKVDYSPATKPVGQ